MQVGDLVRRFDVDVIGLVIRNLGCGRRTVLWSCGARRDIWVGNVQLEVVSESR